MDIPFKKLCGSKENALRRFFVNIESIQAKYCQPSLSSSVIDLETMKVVKNKRALKQSNYQKFGHSHLAGARRKEEPLTYSGDSAIDLDSHDSSLASFHQSVILNVTDAQQDQFPSLLPDESVCSSYDPAVIHYRRDVDQSQANITCLEDIYKALNEEACDDPDISDAETLSDYSSTSDDDDGSSSEDDELDSGNVADNETATATTDNDDAPTRRKIRDGYNDEFDGNVSSFSSRKRRDDFVFFKPCRNVLGSNAHESSPDKACQSRKPDEHFSSTKAEIKNDNKSGNVKSTGVNWEENYNKLSSGNNESNTDRKNNRYDVAVDERDSRKQLMNMTYVVPGLTVAKYNNNNSNNNMSITKSTSTLKTQPPASIIETNISEECKVCSNKGNGGRKCLCVKDENIGECRLQNDSLVSNQRFSHLSPVGNYIKHISYNESQSEMGENGLSSSSDESDSDASSVELREGDEECISGDSFVSSEDALSGIIADASSPARNKDDQKKMFAKFVPVASVFRKGSRSRQSGDVTSCRLPKEHDNANDDTHIDTSSESLSEDVVLMDVNDSSVSHDRNELQSQTHDCPNSSSSVSVLCQTTESEPVHDLDSYKSVSSGVFYSNSMVNGGVEGMSECQQVNLPDSKTSECKSSGPILNSRDCVAPTSERKTSFMKPLMASPSPRACKSMLKLSSPGFRYKSLLPYSDVLDTLITPEFKALTPTASNFDDTFSPSLLDKLTGICLGMSTPTSSSSVKDSVSCDNKPVKKAMTPRNILQEIQSMKLSSPSEPSRNKPKFHRVDILLKPMMQTLKSDRGPGQRPITDPAADSRENATRSSASFKTDRINSCRNNDQKNVSPSSKSECYTKLKSSDGSYKEDADPSFNVEQTGSQSDDNEYMQSSIVVSKCSGGSNDFGPDMPTAGSSSRNSGHHRKTSLNNKCFNHDVKQMSPKVQDFKTETAVQDNRYISPTSRRDVNNSGKKNRIEPVSSTIQRTTVSTSSVFPKAKLHFNASSNCKVTEVSPKSQECQRETASPRMVVTSEPSSKPGRESMGRHNVNDHNTLVTSTSVATVRCRKSRLSTRHSSIKSKLHEIQAESLAHINDNAHCTLRPELKSVSKSTADLRNTDSHRHVDTLSSCVPAKETREKVSKTVSHSAILGKDCTQLSSDDNDLQQQEDEPIAFDKHQDNSYDDNNNDYSYNNRHSHFSKGLVKSTDKPKQFNQSLSRGSKILDRSHERSQLDNHPSKSPNHKLEVTAKEVLKDICSIKKQYSKIDLKTDKKSVSQRELQTVVSTHQSDSKQSAALRRPINHKALLSVVKMGSDSIQPDQINNAKHSGSERLKKIEQNRNVNRENKENSNCDSFKIPDQLHTGMLKAKQMKFPMMRRKNTGDKTSPYDSGKNCNNGFVNSATSSPVVTSTPYKMVQRGSMKVLSPSATMSTICCNESDNSTSPSSSDLEDDTVIVESSPTAFKQSYLLTNTQMSRRMQPQKKSLSPAQHTVKPTPLLQKPHVAVSSPVVVSPYSYLFSPRPRSLLKDAHTNPVYVQSPDLSIIPDHDSSLLPGDDHRHGHYDPLSNNRPSTLCALPDRKSCESVDGTRYNTSRNTEPHVTSTSEMPDNSTSKTNAKFTSRLGKSKSDCIKHVPDGKPLHVSGTPSSETINRHNKQSAPVYSFNMGSGSFKKHCCVAAKGNIHVCEARDNERGVNREKIQPSNFKQQTDVNTLKRTLHGEIKPVFGHRNSFISSSDESSTNAESQSVYELPINSSSSDSDISPRLVERYRHCRKRRKTSRKSLVESFMNCENKNMSYNTTR